MREVTDPHLTVEREVTEIAPDAIIRLDAQGRVCDLDEAAEYLLGLRRAQARGLDLPSLLMPAGESERLRAAIENLLAPPDGGEAASADGLLHRFEISARHADALVFPLEVLVIRADRREPLGEPQVVCLLQDLRARREEEERLLRSESLLAEAEAVGGFGSFELDLNTGALDCSGGLLELLGHRAARPPLRLRELTACFASSDRATFEREIGQARRTRASFELQLELDSEPRSGGEQHPRWVRVRGRILHGQGDQARLVGTLQDVTDIVEARSMREFLGYVVDSSHDAIYTRDAEGRVASWNRGAERLFGFTAEEAIGSTPELTVPVVHLAANQEMIRAVLEGNVVEEFETERLRSDGSLVDVSLSLSPVRDASGRVVAAAAIAHDIGERRRYEQRLQHLADHDPLTDLLNRRRFDQALESELERARRYGTEGAVLSVDIDNLKATNDRFGHAAGDQLIVAAAQVLRRNSRSSDVVARVGGDEFGILLRSGGAEQARVAAEKLLGALRAEPLVVGGCPQGITASIGVALFGDEEMSASDVLAMADVAMYEAKRAGRNQVLVISPAQAATSGRPEPDDLGEKVRRALRNDGFELHWQPIVDLRTGAVNQLEVLLRMRGESGVLLEPAAFLPAAARAGVAPELDRWVLRRALLSLAELPEAERLAVSINLGAASLEGPARLSEFIELLLQEAGLDGSMLVIDINEADAIGNVAAVRELAERLHPLGCSLALDDFGSSFGSFRYLRNLPFDFIKLDSEFVGDVSRSRSDVSVIRAIVAVARGMNIKTVAKSVPDAHTADLLRRQGVDYAQGFHLGSPRPHLRQTGSVPGPRKLAAHAWPGHRRRPMGG